MLYSRFSSVTYFVHIVYMSGSVTIPLLLIEMIENPFLEKAYSNKNKRAIKI